MAPPPRPARIPGARSLDGSEYHEAPRGRALLGGFYLERRGSGFVLGKLIHIKHNATSKRLVVRDLVLSAFRAIQWLIEWPLFMDSTEVNLARRSRVDVEALAKQSRVHLNEGKETNGGLVSAVLLARAPRERYVRTVPRSVPDQQNVLSRDWLGRDFFLCSNQCWRAFIASF